MQVGYFVALLRQYSQLVIFDFTPRTIKLLGLRKEVHGKYSSGDGGIYRFHFTLELLADLKKRAESMNNQDDLCIALYCSESEQPCILTYTEFSKLALLFSKSLYFDLCVELKKRSFKVTVVSDGGAARRDLYISKKVSQRKILH